MSTPQTRDRPRRRNPPEASPKSQEPSHTKHIDAGPSLEKEKPKLHADGHLTPEKAVGIAGAMIHSNLPALLSWGLVAGLIFGGCCSNVFALEKVVKDEPESGILITFSQFLICAIFSWPRQFSASHPPFFLKPRAIPLMAWVPNIGLFFAINILNNYAFGYNISVPVHIILRSGGSVMTMVVGYIWGKRFTRVQVFSVVMLTFGVVLAAMADAQSKGKTSTSTSTPTMGLFILFVAQLLSALMGLYVEITYKKYGSHWQENLFYSHFLSLPLFLPILPSLMRQYRQLLTSPPLKLSISNLPLPSILTSDPKVAQYGEVEIPTHIFYLALNSLTQYACIRGVNSLAAVTSALGVTIVLNMRKLVSLFISILLFGNRLPPGVVLGAAIVFGSAGIWAWDGQRRRGQRGHGEKREGQGKENEKDSPRVNGNKLG